MALEQGDYITDLIPTNPTPTDFINEGDDHLRLLKKVIQQSFPNIDSSVTSSPEDLNNGIVPVGGIIMWNGLLTSLPANWALCNGSNGTPNLQSRFIMSSTGDAGLNPTGSTGGSDAANGDVTVGDHLLDGPELAGHTHTVDQDDTSVISQATAIFDSHEHANVISWPATNIGGTIGAILGTVGVGGVEWVYPPGETGGATGLRRLRGNTSSGNNDLNLPHTHEDSFVSGAAGTNNPLYYALAFIQRVA